jgi:hypothetical protein
MSAAKDMPQGCGEKAGEVGNAAFKSLVLV